MRIFVLLLAVLSLSSTVAAADGAGLTPIPVLIDKAKKALAEEDDETYDGVMDQLYERITGFPASFSELPEGVSDELYIHKVCQYDRVIDTILTPALLDVMRYQAATMAYSIVAEGSENDVSIRAMKECVYEDGRPTRVALLMLDGIAWVKKLNAANAEEALLMAQEIQALAVKKPHIKELITLSKLARFDAEGKREEERPKSKGEKQRDLIHRLEAKAFRGDLASQLELARRLEAGDLAPKKFVVAYYWYSLAKKNSGGDTAQAGLNRLLPQLSEDDLWTVKIWMKRKGLPVF